MTIETDVQKLEPGSIVELFELDLTPFGSDLLRFHAGTNGLLANVTWDGNVYTAFPVAASGFEFTGQGQAPRPKLMVSNVAGAITALVLQYADLVGAKVTRRRTLAKYLDAVNFKRDNLLVWSEDITKTNYFATNLSKTNVNTVTLTSVADPGVGQIVSGLGSILGRTFSFGVEARGIGASVGKYLRLFMYSLTVNEVKSALVGPLTADYQLFSLSGTFTTSTDTGLNFRVDQEGAPAWTIGDTLNVTNWRANEGASLATYQFTTGTWNPTADPTAEFPHDIFYIDRKSVETNEIVEFELAPAMELTGVLLPRRQIIQNICPWRYRGSECGYTGTTYFDASDVSVGSAGLDVCGKRLTSCKLRFGQYAELPYGGFPVAGLFR